MCLEILASVLSIFGFTEIVITDHDVLGLDLRKFRHRAIKQFFHYMGMEIIPGIELSCKFPLGGNQEKEFHIVGLGIYHVNDLLMEAMKFLREGREKRAKEIVNRILEAGYEVDCKRIGKNKNITLLNIAENVYKNDGSRGGVEFLEKYLISGKKFYYPKELLGVKRAIEIINSLEGIASWAHPFTTLGKRKCEIERVFEQFLNFGMEAVEVYTRKQTIEGVEILEGLCERHSYRLECFAGSDTHTLLDIFLYVERLLELFREMEKKNKVQNGSEQFVPYFCYSDLTYELKSVIIFVDN